MKKSIRALLFVSAIVTSGCVTYDQVQAANRSKLMLLSAGMSKQEVLSAMGTSSIRVADGGVITNPYRSEMYRSQGHVIELLMYYTDRKKADGAITDDELTPLIIMDGKLDGWGWSYWQDIVQKYEIRMR